MSQEQQRDAFVVAIILLALWLLSKLGLSPRESVTATVGGNSLGTVPQFSPSNPATLPANWPSNAVPPIDGEGNITTNIADPTKATCPAGYQLWRNADSGAFWCILSHLSDGSQGPV